MAASLAEARSETKTLSVRLAATRSDAGVPGSAVKGGVARPMSNQEIVQAMQMKEDLYGDLTGLIVRGIKHEGGEDVYDCIQTGRNGSKFSRAPRASSNGRCDA